jgi:hypothetical protein
MRLKFGPRLGVPHNEKNSAAVAAALPQIDLPALASGSAAF